MAVASAPPKRLPAPKSVNAAAPEARAIIIPRGGPARLGLVHQIQGGRTHRARGAQDGDATADQDAPRSTIRTISRPTATTTTANIRPSTRSSRPPWPGMVFPASLTPNRRFSADSHRSPAMVAKAAARDEGLRLAAPGQALRHLNLLLVDDSEINLEVAAGLPVSSSHA